MNVVEDLLFNIEEAIPVILDTKRSALLCESYTRGYHAYMIIWNPVIGDDSLFCQIQKENPFDESAVAVIHNNLYHNRVVGHVPTNICSLFKRFLGLPTSSITATVTGKRVNRGAGDDT